MAASIAVVLEKLEMIDKNQVRAEGKIYSLDCKIRALEQDKAKRESMAVTVDDHEKRIRELEKLAPAMRAVIWLAGVLGVSVVALIWGLITGDIMLVYK